MAEDPVAADAARFRVERDERLAKGGPLSLDGLAASLYAHAAGKPRATRAMLIQAADVVSLRANGEAPGATSITDPRVAAGVVAGVDAAIALVRRWAEEAPEAPSGEWCAAVASDMQANREFLIETAKRGRSVNGQQG